MPMDPELLIAGLMLFSMLYAVSRIKPTLIKLTESEALIRTRPESFPGGGAVVLLKSDYVIKQFDRWEIMDISLQNMEVERASKNPLRTLDGQQITLRAFFQLRIPPDEEQILAAAKMLGSKKASDADFLRTTFEPRFSEALETAAARWNLDDIQTRRDEFRDAIIEIIGIDMGGFQLEDLAIKDFKALTAR